MFKNSVMYVKDRPVPTAQISHMNSASCVFNTTYRNILYWKIPVAFLKWAFWKHPAVFLLINHSGGPDFNRIYVKPVTGNILSVKVF